MFFENVRRLRCREMTLKKKKKMLFTAFHLRATNLKTKMWNVSNTVPCQHLPEDSGYNTERKLEKQSTIHQLIITLRHTLTVWTKKKKKHAFICPSLIPHSGWLMHTVQYHHVEMATLIDDVPAPHIFHSYWQITHNSTALVSFLSSQQYNTPWTMVLVSDLFINIS